MCHHLHGALLAPRGHPLPVGAELEAVDSFTMAFVGKNATFSPDVPQLEVCVPGSGAQKITVWMKVKAPDSRFVSCQSANQSGGL